MYFLSCNYSSSRIFQTLMPSAMETSIFQNLFNWAIQEFPSKLQLKMINLQCIHNKLKGKFSEKNLGGFYTHRPTVWLPRCLHTAKDLPAAQETWVQSLGQEDPPEKGMATHSVFLPGKPHGQGAWRATVHEAHARVRYD